MNYFSEIEFKLLIDNLSQEVENQPPKSTSEAYFSIYHTILP